MAIAFGDKTSGGFDYGVTPKEITAPAVSGSNTYMLFGLLINAGGEPEPTTATYDGVSLGTPIASFRVDYVRVMLWGLANPGSAKVFAVTGLTSMVAVLFTWYYTGINQGTPYRTASTASMGNPGSNPVTVDVTNSQVNDVIVGLFGCDDTTLGTVGAGQTSRGVQSGGTSNDAYGGICDEPGASGTVVHSWAINTTIYGWGVIAVPLIPAGGGETGGPEAVLKITRRLPGTLSASLSVAASAKRARGLRGTISAAASIVGNLTVSAKAFVLLAGTWTANAAVSAGARITKRLIGASAAIGSFFGSLKRTQRVQGVLTAVSSFVGLSKLRLRLQSVAPNILKETFMAPGYDNTGWTETVGGGCVVDEDYMGVTGPRGLYGEVLKIQRVSPNYSALTVKDISERTKLYVTGWINAHAQGQPTYWSDSFFRMAVGSDSENFDGVYFIWKRTTASTWAFQAGLRENGGSSWSAFASGAISLDTWYQFGVYWDVEAHLFEFRYRQLGGAWTVFGSGTIRETHTPNCRYVFLGATAKDYPYTDEIYIGPVLISDAGWPAGIDSSSSIFAVSRVTRKLFGTLSAAASLSALSRIGKRLMGTLAAAASFVGDLTVEIPGWVYLSGSFAAQSAISAGARVLKEFRGSFEAVSSVIGLLKPRRKLAGVLSSAASISARVKLQRGLKGQIFVQTSFVAYFRRIRRLMGTIISSSSVVGAIATTAEVFLQGAFSAVSSISAFIKRRQRLIGTLSASGTFAAFQRVTKKLRGSLSANAALSAVIGLAGKVFLQGHLTAQSAISGMVRARKRLTGTLTANAAFAAVMKRVRRLRGTLAAALSVSAALRRLKSLRGSFTAVLSTSGFVKRLRKIQGTLSAALSSSAVFKRYRGLRGEIDASSSFSAVMLKRIRRIMGAFAAIASLSATAKLIVSLRAAFNGVASFVGLLYVKAKFIYKTRLSGKIENVISRLKGYIG